MKGNHNLVAKKSHPPQHLAPYNSEEGLLAPSGQTDSITDEREFLYSTLRGSLA